MYESAPKHEEHEDMALMQQEADMAQLFSAEGPREVSLWAFDAAELPDGKIVVFLSLKRFLRRSSRDVKLKCKGRVLFLSPPQLAHIPSDAGHKK